MSDTTEKEREQLILRLYDVGAVKFGDFKLKSGIQSPAYFDLRVIVSYPELMPIVSAYLWNAAKHVTEKFVSVCGVPYTALPIATVMSVEHNIPMLIRRREAKDYGTKKMIEGHYRDGDVCLVLEDVTTSGSSVLETVKTLNDVRLVVRDAVVLLEREQGAVQKLREAGIALHSVFTMTKLIQTLHRNKRVDTDMLNKVLQFIHDNRFDRPPAEDGQQNIKTKKELTYSERAESCDQKLSRRLFTLMEQKKTNLVISVDLTTSEDILSLVDRVGAHVCMVKTHVDIISDFSTSFTTRLQELAEKHNFLIFEDRKFADIGNTVVHQYSGGVYKISEWSHVVNAHCLPGPAIVKALKQVGGPLGRGCLLIAEMSSAGNLATGEYTKATVKIAEDNRDFVSGFICQSRLSDDPQFIHMTPGIQLEEGKDGLGQQYFTPRDAILTRKSDTIIVGRGITMATDPVQAAIQYKEAGFQAYLERTAS